VLSWPISARTEREHTLDIEALMRRFARQLNTFASRGADAPRPPTHLPATIRRSVASGGAPFHLAWRPPAVRPRSCC
jgi:hypothetical protein